MFGYSRKFILREDPLKNKKLNKQKQSQNIKK